MLTAMEFTQQQNKSAMVIGVTDADPVQADEGTYGYSREIIQNANAQTSIKLKGQTANATTLGEPQEGHRRNGDAIRTDVYQTGERLSNFD